MSNEKLSLSEKLKKAVDKFQNAYDEEIKYLEEKVLKYRDALNEQIVKNVNLESEIEKLRCELEGLKSKGE